ncbi:MAG: fatty acid desaturase family protein [Planctomycetota bacterium]|jgi:linoleoyl-CoA desaturase
MSEQPTHRVQYPASNEFLNYVRARVDRYFRMTGRSPYAPFSMYLKTGIVLLSMIGFYVGLVFFASTWWVGVLLAIGLGLAIAAVGFNVQHDGGHKAYSRSPAVNRFMAGWLDLMGASSVVWARKHNTLHHTYTNLHGHDDDIDLGIFARVAPEQKRYFFHRAQHIYLWFLYTLITAKWQVWDDFRDVIRGRIGEHKLQRPKGWDLVQFIGGKVVFFTPALVLPMMVHSVWSVLLFYAIANLTAGLTISVVFQLAHVVETTEFPEPKDGMIETPWAIHQLHTTADFGRNNRLLSWYVGGLNFQVEHHLFPRICHVHYRKISRIVEHACRKAGITYNAFPSLRAAIASHYRSLKAMGKAPEPQA